MNTPALRLVAGLKAPLEPPPPAAVRFGCDGVDAVCGGGLAAGTHQIAGLGAAVLGFGLALSARVLALAPGARVLLVQAQEAGCEGGHVYAPGLHALGLDPDRVGVAQVRTGTEALRGVDEALRSGAVAAVLADLGHAPRLDRGRGGRGRGE